MTQLFTTLAALNIAALSVLLAVLIESALHPRKNKPRISRRTRRQ